MAGLQPTFSLRIGALQASTASAAASPSRMVAERDMHVPADALRVRLADRGRVTLDDDVELSLGYDGTEAAVFAGTVASLRPAVDGVEVWALGGLHALLDLYVGVVFEDQTAGGVVRDLIGRVGLTAGTIDDGPSL